ncbi:hypothetical protein ABS71_21880 [bacterium SCN 62-11]|nr:hypothetical protein [Candidatus Eremiobacteraeota bacterium]ODT56433.1 MAG: hypothetical protein ABS71_21880 [bacterium SCN 62-11]
MKYSECEKWLKSVGLCTVLPGKTGLWPCLLWAVQGHQGPFSGWDVGFQNAWAWKDQLPAEGRAWAGHLLGSQVMLVHASLLPVFLGARGALEVEELYEDGGLSQTAYRVYQHLRSASAEVGRAQLRKALGLKPSEFDKACRDLERLLVITRCGAVSEGPGWGSNSYALVERHFAGISPMAFGAARSALGEILRKAAPEATDAQRKRWMKSLSG